MKWRRGAAQLRAQRLKNTCELGTWGLPASMGGVVGQKGPEDRIGRLGFCHGNEEL